ncbi:hypothetical protein Tco_1574168, partial [Tanacetum coccineum]
MDDFGVEVDLKILGEHPIGYQERDCLVEEMVSFLKNGVRSVVEMEMRIFDIGDGGLDDEAWVEAMEEQEEEEDEDDDDDDDDDENEDGDHLIKMRWINV